MAGWRQMLAAPAALVSLAACVAGARLDAGAYVVRTKGYRVTAPAGWERIDSEADLALRHPGLGAGLMAHGSCEGPTPRRSLPVLARHLRFGLREVTRLDEMPVELAGQRGMRSRFAATLDGVPVGVSAVTLQGTRCVWDLVVVAPAGGLAAVADDFTRFTESFGLVGTVP